MELKEGYKVLCNHIDVDGTGKVYAKKSDADEGVAVTFKTGDGAVIGAETIKQIKLVYSKDNRLFYSTTGVPASTDEDIIVYAGTKVIFGEISSADVLGNAKKAKIKLLNAYITESALANYSSTNQETLKTKVASGIAAINKATSVEAVNTAFTSAETEVKAVKTKAQELAAKKTSSCKVIDEYKKSDIEGNKYYEAQVTEITNIKTQAKTDINAQADITKIDGIVSAKKALIDAVKTKAQVDAESAEG